MKLKVCPRCRNVILEQINAFEICQNCNYSAFDKFTKSDYEVVREAIKKLPELEKEIIFLKFWKRCDLATIADQLELKLRTVEKYLNSAYSKLKSACLCHPDFSRSSDNRLPLAA